MGGPAFLRMRLRLRDSIMPIRFKCPHCQKTLGVKDHLAGRKANCPVCKQAMVNQPEQLQGAWGSEQKSRVSTGSLLEAGAITVAEADPIGLTGWLKRAFWTATVIGLVALAFVGMTRSRSDKRTKDDLNIAL